MLQRPIVAARSHSPVQSMLAGLLLAGTLLGLADALAASWSNRTVAPHATLPLCLTAPFVVATLVLLPLALLGLLPPYREATVRARAAGLLGVAAGAAVLRVAIALHDAWRGTGTTALGPPLLAASVAAAACAAWASRKVALACLRRIDERWIARLVVVAAITQAAALAGVGWLVQREGRGVVRDALAAKARVAPSSATAAGQGRSGPAPAGRPENLVLITIDTLRADHLDGSRMPRSSALAADGASFAAAYAASSWTLPALASLMTGLPAAEHGAGRALGEDPLARSPLSPEHATLATRLARAGFATRAIVTNPYLGLGYGLGQGFASFENVTLESEAALTLRPTLGFWLLEQLMPALAIVDRGDAVTRRAARFLAARERGGRFFLWLHYVDPHAPYDGATRSFRDDLLAGGAGAGALPRMAQLRAGEIRPLPAGREALRAAYARAVRAVDVEVGAILDLLDRHDLAARTVVALTADHGEEFWDHGGVEHGHTLFAELVHVPLLIRCPGCAPSGSRIAAPVGIAGLAATLLELLVVAPEPGAPGPPADAGFAGLVRGEPLPARPVVSENLLFAEERVALRTGRYTYVAWVNGKEELYDRLRDPGELRDLAARRRLLRRHRELLASLRRPAPEEAAANGERKGTGVTAVTRRALQALGYVE